MPPRQLENRADCDGPRIRKQDRIYKGNTKCRRWASFFIPFFFVTSGIDFDLDALGSVEALAKLAMFFGLFLVVRGVPALLLYRGVLDRRERGALAFYCATELPLVVAITSIAVEAGHMKTSTAAGLVGAAMLSTLVFPFLAAALRRQTAEEGAVPAVV
jgi:Kef-type K+ transport system membrane component KefB